MQYKWMVAILGLAMIAGTLGVTSANAEAQGDETRQPLVQKIAERFNLNEADVQAVFDEEKTGHMNQMQQKFDDRLAQAVLDGKIDLAQKQLILDKRAELQKTHGSDRETFKNMTPKQRQAAKQTRHADLQAWATEKGIDLRYLMPGPKGGPQRGHPDKMMRHLTEVD
ncbi:MAG: hypothetical protein AAB647_04390 [Patescibacteria group bacterium]